MRSHRIRIAKSESPTTDGFEIMNQISDGEKIGVGYYREKFGIGYSAHVAKLMGMAAEGDVFHILACGDFDIGYDLSRDHESIAAGVHRPANFTRCLIEGMTELKSSCEAFTTVQLVAWMSGNVEKFGMLRPPIYHGKDTQESSIMLTPLSKDDANVQHSGLEPEKENCD